MQMKITSSRIHKPRIIWNVARLAWWLAPAFDACIGGFAGLITLCSTWSGVVPDNAVCYRPVAFAKPSPYFSGVTEYGVVLDNPVAIVEPAPAFGMTQCIITPDHVIQDGPVAIAKSPTHTSGLSVFGIVLDSPAAFAYSSSYRRPVAEYSIVLDSPAAIVKTSSFAPGNISRDHIVLDRTVAI